MTRTGITSTEAVRGFSELLNGIRYRGESNTILRGGKPIATIGPVEGTTVTRTLGEIPALLKGLPPLDPEDTTFAADVAEASTLQPLLPSKPAWG